MWNKCQQKNQLVNDMPLLQAKSFKQINLILQQLLQKQLNMNQSESFAYYNINIYFDSPDQADIQLPQEHQQSPLLNLSPSPQNPPRRKKVQKQKIRTNRNSQKIYHNILKHWLIDNGFYLLSNKYHKYFNQRIYFILVLQEIAKQIDNKILVDSYRHMAQAVKKKKENEMRATQQQMLACEYINHLGRIIQEIDFSIAACQAFVAGNVMDSIIIVFKRSQKKITKVKQFKQALRIYEREVGMEAQNMG